MSQPERSLAQRRRFLPAAIPALLAILALGWTFAQANRADETAPGTITNVIAEGTTGPFQIQRLAAPLFGRHGPPIVENAVESYRITYLSTGLDGEPVEVSARLFVPVLERARTRPLYVFGAGTTGVADICAPSREMAYPHPLGHYRAYLLAFAGRGFTAIIPDYLGFNDPERLQSYFNAEAEARVMLDAIRAVEAFFERQGAPGGGSRSVFVGGYSQGGHAAFSAADRRAGYAPELEIDGVLGFGATTDVESLLREGPFYAPYIVLSYRQDYGEELFDPADVLAPRWLPGLEQAAGELCVDRVQQHYPFDAGKIYDPEFGGALRARTLASDFPAIARILENNRTGLSGHGVPALVVQGEDDVIVGNNTQTAFVRGLCRQDSKVLYLRYPGVRHRETRPVAFEESIAWMRSLAAGQAPPSSCALLEGEQ
jgi:pimeloyl-ACP methyl ester carboxylesterase